METGFLNKHDEYFSSDVTYEQSNDFESEGSLFSSFVNDTFNNEFDDYQWVMNEGENVDASFNGIPTENPVHQDDFNKSFNDWQQHISNLKREDDFTTSNLFLHEEKIADIFPSCSPRQLSSPTLPFIESDDPLNPDLLLAQLSDSPTSPDPEPVTAPPEPTQLWGIKASGPDLSIRLSRIKIKQEPKDAGYSPAPSPAKVHPIEGESVEFACDELSSFEPSTPLPEPVPVIGHLPDTSTDLGPDNYDVVDIKVEGEEEEEVEIDVETVTDSMPVIQAKDITSLLDQFEATERVNSICKSKWNEVKTERWVSVETPMTPKVPPLIIKKTSNSLMLKVEPAPSPKASPQPFPSPKASPQPFPSPKASPQPLPSPKASPQPLPSPKASPQPSTSPSASPFSAPRSGPANKTIIDSFPHEVIERIKKSSSKKKKIVPVVPAERLPAKGNSHMKDAGASKSKIRDLVNKKKIKTESAQVQMDHDYCTNENKANTEVPKADCSVKPKVAPPAKPPVTVVVDAFSVTEEDKWVLDNEQKLMTSLITASPSPSEASSNARNNWEKNSKRDSGLESGDVSDASESPSDKKCLQKAKPVENFNEVQMMIEKEDCPDTPETLSETHIEVPNQLLSNDPAYDQDKETKKKKLNLDEYRSRRKFARLSSPVKTGTIGEAILSNKWVQRPPKEVEPKPIEEEITRVVTPEVRVEPSPKKIEEEKRRRDSRSRERTKSRYRHRSSSSSSSESRVRSSRVRGRSRDRRRTSHRSPSRTRNVWSRSRSRSCSSDSSSSSSRSRSRSESRNRSRSRSRCTKRYRGRSRSRSRSSYRRRTPRRRYSHNRFSSDRVAVAPRRTDEWNNVERQKQVEERRVIYVGQIEEGTTKSQLRERFQMFGLIVDISLHFRERGDNYGFVTFAHKGDAYKAVEHGNDNPKDTRYEICFGGRRAFCKQRYADLDSVTPQATYSPYHQSRSNESFDSLLRAAREKLLRNAKAV